MRRTWQWSLLALTLAWGLWSGTVDAQTESSTPAGFGVLPSDATDEQSIRRLRDEVVKRVQAAEQAGNTQAAQTWSALLGEADRLLEGQRPAGKLELHVLGLYEGDTFKGDRGFVAVKVTDTSAPLILALGAYESVHWQIEAAPGVAIEQVILSGYEPQYVSGLPEGTSVADYSRGRESGEGLPYAYSRQSDDSEGPRYPRLVAGLKKLTGLEPSTFQGAYSPQRKPFVVGPESLDWRRERAAKALRAAYVAATAEDRRALWTRLASLEFNAISSFSSDPQAHPHFGQFDAYYGKHTIFGPLRGKVKPLGQNFNFGAVDSAADKLYTGQPAVIDLADGQEEAIPIPENAGLPGLSHPCSAAFDSKRGRFLLASLGGEGFLYAYDVKQGAWSVLRDMDNLDVGAMAYDAQKDVVYWLVGGHHQYPNGGPLLVTMDPEGAILSRVVLGGMLAMRGHDPFQSHKCLTAVDGFLILYMPQQGGENADGKPVCQVIDLAASQVIYEGALMASSTRDEQTAEMHRRLQGDAVASAAGGHLAPEPKVTSDARSTKVDVIVDRPLRPLRNPANGHYYELLTDLETTWEEAKAIAEKRVFRGMQGHLATITSAQENEFLALQWGGKNAWIGASDAEQEGEWKWMTGPEAGHVFWRANGDQGEAVSYANWSRDHGLIEPNNMSGGEHYAIWNWGGAGAGHTWNDVAPDRTCNSILVEFSPAEEQAPEPAATPAKTE
ncbi:MAG: C-type lectin domain-containing protein [Pirellulales bacterium]